MEALQEINSIVEEIRDLTTQQIAELISDERRRTRKAAELATHDELTELLNRRGLNEAIDILEAEHARDEWPSEQKLQGYAVFVDADNLHKVNRIISQQAGDGFLIAVGNAIELSTIRDTDLKARLGGDEFIIVLPHTDKDGVFVVLNKVVNMLKHEEDGAQTEFPGIEFSASFGVCSFGQERNIRVALKIAEDRMKEAKNKNEQRGTHIDTIIID